MGPKTENSRGGGKYGRGGGVGGGGSIKP